MWFAVGRNLIVGFFFLLVPAAAFGSSIDFTAQTDGGVAEQVAPTHLACAVAVAWKHRDEVLAQARNDKWNHCALSCLMTIHCGPIQAAQAGVLKELIDLIGPGNAEIADWSADVHGIRIGMRLIGRLRPASRGDCYVACSIPYPESSTAQLP